MYYYITRRCFVLETHLGHKLSVTRKMVYSGFPPYMAKPWCAIAKLIESKILTGHFNYYDVNRFAGHKNIQTTIDYVDPAKQYFRANTVNWYSHALKHRNEGKHDFPNRRENRGLLGKVSSVTDYGLGEI